MARYFLIKTQISLENCVKLGDTIALEHHETLHGLLRDRFGGPTAALFAEPLLSRGNDAAPASVSWYAEFDGKARALSTLPASAREAVETYLADTLAPIRGVLDDPQAGPLLGAALWQLDPNDILVVGGRPVLVNWGMRPARLGADESALAGHYSATLGRYLPLATPPGLAPSAATESSAAPHGAAVAGAAGLAAAGTAVAGSALAGTGETGVFASDPAAALTAGTGAASHAAIPPTLPPTSAGSGDTSYHRRLPVIAWLPLVLLLGLATLILAWLLLPGTRLFPPINTQPVISDASAVALAEQVNRDLREHRDRLRDAFAGAVCRPDGTLVVPSGRTPQGLLPPALATPPGETPPAGNAPQDRTEAAPDAVLPPDPARVMVPVPETPQAQGEGGGELSQVNLLEAIEARTVLVLSKAENGMSSGTGIVVGPGLIVTNNHVITDAASGGRIVIFNKLLRGPETAEVIKRIGPLQEQGGDFALLRISDTSLPAYQVHISPTTLKLKNVIAAGFPGDVLATDIQFKALMRGDRSSVPDLTVTDGVVTTEQALSPSTHVLVHSAPLSGGNSGGPLVDMCGRLVGVNTFVRRGDLRTLNFALASPDMIVFLQDTPAQPQQVTEACVPQVLRPAPNVAEAPADPTPPSRDPASDSNRAAPVLPASE